MNIININKEIYSEKYLEDRDILWNDKIKEYGKNKIPLWNGIVYYLDRIEPSQTVENIYIGKCEYKDLMFRDEYGLDYIREKYNLDFNFTYINVQVVLKKDKNKYVFGRQKSGDKIKLILVGGTLRLEDGIEIDDFEKIVSYAIKEIEVETNLVFKKDNLHFQEIINNDSICTFLFDYFIPEKCEEPFLKIGEFDGEVHIMLEETENKNNYILNDRLASVYVCVKELWINKKL